MSTSSGDSDKSASSVNTTLTNSTAVLPTVPSAKEEVHHFENWTLKYKSSHILFSQCTNNCQNDNLCLLCRFKSELELPHLPEMVFPNNILELKHASGFTIKFSALEALKEVNKENKSVKIACSQAWKSSREYTGLVDNNSEDFDWTYRTDYSGTFKNWVSREITDECIDMNRLKQIEPIQLYKELMLYDDELHDNGVAVCNVRIRVMPSCFFILLRYFLRVDDVLIMANDARIFHDFFTDYVLLETSSRENEVTELKVPISVMTIPDEVTPLLSLKSIKREKLMFPRSTAS